MKSLQKLALASAIALTSAGAFAMQAMDDESMSAATGQDGITMKIALPCYNAVADSCNPTDAHGLSINQVFVEDVLGFSAKDSTDTLQTYSNTGYILIDGISVTTTAGAPITVLIDQTGNSGNTGAAAAAQATDTPTLNVNVTVPAIKVALGTTYVTNGHDSADVNYKQTKISNAMSISTSGNTTLNIQLGSQPQGALVKVDTTISGGLVIRGSGLHDGGASYGGDIFTGEIDVTNAGGSALTVKAAVNVSSTGAPWVAYAPSGALIVKLTQLGAAGVPNIGGAGGLDVTLKGTRIGYVPTTTDVSGNIIADTSDASLAKALGDVYIKGLNINGTRLMVYGH